MAVGGWLNDTSAQESPPGDRCSGPFDSKQDYCLPLGYISFGNGAAVNRICKENTDCQLDSCTRPECYGVYTPCDNEFISKCADHFFDDGKTALICSVAMFYQSKRFELQPEYPGDCDGDELNLCPSGICRGCRPDEQGRPRSWCGCDHTREWEGIGGSLECPANECCSEGLILPVCAPQTAAYSGWGWCPDFYYDKVGTCGRKGGYPIVDSCSDPDPFRPITDQMCGWYADGIEGVDYIRDYSYDGGPAKNPKFSCHFCKGTTYLEPKPTSCFED